MFIVDDDSISASYSGNGCKGGGGGGSKWPGAKQARSTATLSFVLANDARYVQHQGPLVGVGITF